MKELRGQYDFEDLSAYLDGELEPARKAGVEKLLQEDSSWQAAHAELKALDGALDAWTAPEMPAHLPGRVVTAVKRSGKQRVIRFARIAAPIAAVAAAAAIFVAVLLSNNSSQPRPKNNIVRNTTPPPTNKTTAVNDKELNDIAVENLEFFRDYDVLTNFETLEAIERLEKQSQI